MPPKWQSHSQNEPSSMYEWPDVAVAKPPTPPPGNWNNWDVPNESDPRAPWDADLEDKRPKGGENLGGRGWGEETVEGRGEVGGEGVEGETSKERVEEEEEEEAGEDVEEAAIRVKGRGAGGGEDEVEANIKEGPEEKVAEASQRVEKEEEEEGSEVEDIEAVVARGEALVEIMLVGEEEEEAAAGMAVVEEETEAVAHNVAMDEEGEKGGEEPGAGSGEVTVAVVVVVKAEVAEVADEVIADPADRRIIQVNSFHSIGNNVCYIFLIKTIESKRRTRMVT
ncbi:hypothetical protein BDD12DRAFT_873116 [Trichophaea hybrida]|nr:hypothetical protein BDD12DRAFT_873116 [Trichophaea hybrida]